MDASVIAAIEHECAFRLGQHVFEQARSLHLAGMGEAEIEQRLGVLLADMPGIWQQAVANTVAILTRGTAAEAPEAIQ